MIRRRDVLALLGGAAAAWPVRANSQEKKVRRIAFLSPFPASNPEGDARLAAFVGELRRLGWDENRLHVEVRWGGSAADIRRHAAEVVSLAPEVIIASGSAVIPVLQITEAIPLVFINVIDAQGVGIVESISRPGRNATGFMQMEYSTSAKWLDLLKEIAPRLARVAVLRDNTEPSGLGQFAAIQSAAPSLGVEVQAINMADKASIERAVTQFAKEKNSGLIATAGRASTQHRELITHLADRHKLPTAFAQSFFVRQGGLLSYVPDLAEQHRGAAGYVDRILKGEKASSLPVQAPTKYELAVNLKTARDLGLTVPATLLARADEVIE